MYISPLISGSHSPLRCPAPPLQDWFGHVFLLATVDACSKGGRRSESRADGKLAAGHPDGCYLRLPSLLSQYPNRFDRVSTNNPFFRTGSILARARRLPRPLPSDHLADRRITNPNSPARRDKLAFFCRSHRRIKHQRSCLPLQLGSQTGLGILSESHDESKGA